MAATLPLLAGEVLAEVSPQRAIDEMQRGHFDRAAELLRPMVKQFPRNADLWNLLGVCESELSHVQSSEAAFRSGLRVAPTSVALKENLGLFYFRNEHYAEARSQLVAAVESGSVKPEVKFSLAASEVRTGEAKQGLQLLREIEPALSNRVEYWTERGWVELRIDSGSAQASFDRALAIEADNLRALNGAASAAEARGEDEKALSLLIRARKAYPDDLRVLLHFASLCLRTDLDIDAADALAHARSLAPANNLALFLSAQVETAFQHWQKSHDLFVEFDHRAPNYASAQYALGWLDRKLGCPDEARTHLEQSLKLDTQLLDARCELGELELSEGNLPAAETELRRVLSVRPDHARAVTALGDLLTRRGLLDEAETAYEQAIRSDPKSGPAHYKLSVILLRKHETERAERERTMGTKLNEEALRTSRTVLRLSEPDGQLLSEAK